jgi:hypothetical protein
MYGRLAAQFINTAHGMSSVAEEGTDLEGELDISGLGARQQTGPANAAYKITPTTRTGTHLDRFQNSQNENVQSRIPPPHDYALMV